MKKVFLGGTCNNSKWRDKIIPKLKIDLYNPVVDDWNEEIQKREILERETCDYCLYVITPKMTGFYSIAEVIDDSNKRPEKTLFTFLDNDENDTFSKHQLKTLAKIEDMVKKNGGKSFKTLPEIVQFLNKSNE